MDEFKEMLLLRYIDLNMNIDGFDCFIELSGMLYQNLIELLNNLIKEKLIIYNEHNFIISKKGIEKLKEYEMDKFEFSSLNEEVSNLKANKCMDIYDIYIPKTFNKKK